MASTKWGIASAGKICHDMVNAILALENSSEHEIVAVAARNLANAKEFAAKFNIPNAYEGYESLANDQQVKYCICVLNLSCLYFWNQEKSFQ